MIPEPPDRSGVGWSRGLRPSHAIVLEVVRIALGFFLAATLVFLVFQIWSGAGGLWLSPHDPKYAGIAAVDRQIFALDQPPWTRYGVWLADVFAVNLGISFYFREPVAVVLLESLPATLELVLGAALWALVLGGLLGRASASTRHRLLAWLTRESASVLYAIPVFATVLALVLGVGTAFQIDLARPQDPAFLFGPPRVTGLPVLDSLLTGDLDLIGRAFVGTALLSFAAGIAFTMPVAHRVRKGLEARRARLAGSPPRAGRERFVSLLRDLGPGLAGTYGLLVPFFLGAAVVTEILSGRWGVGFLLVGAVYNLDGPLIQGAGLLIAWVALGIGLPLLLLGAGLARESAVPASGGTEEPQGRSPWPSSSLRRTLGRSRGASLVSAVGFVLLLAMLGVALLGPLAAPYAPNQRVVPVGQPCVPGVSCRLSPPSAQYPLGINYLGEDILSRVLWGGVYLLAAVGVALAIAAGIGLALGLLASAAGRGADVVLRAALGGLAAVPVFILLLLVAVTAGVATALVPLALGLLFVPVVFRDVWDAAARTAAPAFPMESTRPWSVGPAARAEAAIAAAVPSFLARLPRRAAEMALLLETLTAIGFASVGPVDWGSEIEQGLAYNEILNGNPAALVVPAILLTLLVLALLLLSDGLQAFVESPPSTGAVDVPAPSASVDAKP